jgi:gliding motility-associated-like protein
LSSTTCNPAQAGVFTQVLTNRFGCDSTVITTISLLPTSQKSIQTYTCDPSQAGVFTYQLVNQFGCDSIVTETRTLLPSSATTVNLTSCNPAQVGMTTQVVPNQYGCDSTITTITTLRPPDACSVSATLLGSTIPCGQSTGTLTLTPTVGTAPFSYTVIKNGSPVNTGSVQALYTPAVINGLSPGSYTVNITSPNGFNFSVQAVINQLLPPDAGATVNSSYSGFSISCDGASDGVALGSASGGQAPYQYVWSSGATTQQAAGLSSGTYTVTVTGSNGCTDTSTVTLSSATPISISFVINNLNCFGQNSGAVKVNVTGGAPPYTYRLNDGPEQTTNLFSNLMAGTFIATVYDANRCEKTEVIVVNAAIQVDVNLGDDLTISQGDEASLRAILNLPIDSIEKITWTPPFDSSDCPQCPDQVVRPFISTVYSIEVQALNGCKDRDDIAVRVDRRRQIYVANVFSPNEDGANDILSVFAKPGSVTNILYFRIYDRWGNEVYELQNFLPNNPTQGWDGTFNGEPMDPGVFVWAAEIEFIDGERIVYKGDVTIVR